MGSNFRVVSDSDEFEVVGRGRKATESEFASCELGGKGYMFTQDINYVPDNSTNENLPKLTTIRQKLLNYAKKWTERRKAADPTAKDVIVKTETRVLKDGKIPVLWYQFNEGERKPRKKKTVTALSGNVTLVSDVNENAENTQESVQ